MNGLSIIIPTLNEEKYLPNLLDTISKQKYEINLQIIVVDGKSVDKTVEVAESFKNKISDLSVVKSVADIGLQKNAGVTKAKYDHLLFLDADVELPQNTLTELICKVPKDQYFVLTVMHKFRNLNFVDNLFYLFGKGLLRIFLKFKQPIMFGDFIFTNFDTHQKIGGFKEGVLLGEDVDYCKRVREVGGESYFLYKPAIFASLRRVRTTGRLKLFILWVRAFMHVKKYGPIYKNEGYEYEFGNYD